MSFLFPRWAVLAIALTSAPYVKSDSLVYSVHGIFGPGGGTPLDPNGGTFSAQFVLPVKPITSNSGPGNLFIYPSIQPFAATYTVNATPIAVTPDFLEFFGAPLSVGGLGFKLSDTAGNYVVLGLFGSQLYSGPEAAPTLLQTSFTPTNGLFADQTTGANVFSLESGTTFVGVPSVAVPEPGASVVMLSILTVCAIRSRLTQKSTDRLL